MEVKSNALDYYMNHPMSQKEWTSFIQKTLQWLCENNPPPSSNLFFHERQLLPENFAQISMAHFCYTYKGIFLPSGNHDGRVWKPSQGAKPTGDGLMKRYFYYKESGVKIKRQVIWIKEDENWCFLDYRCNFKGKIRLSNIITPTGFDFPELVLAVDPMILSESEESIAPIDDESPKEDISSLYTNIKDQQEELAQLILNKENQLQIVVGECISTPSSSDMEPSLFFEFENETESERMSSEIESEFSKLSSSEVFTNSSSISPSPPTSPPSFTEILNENILDLGALDLVPSEIAEPEPGLIAPYTFTQPQVVDTLLVSDELLSDELMHSSKKRRVNESVETSVEQVTLPPLSTSTGPASYFFSGFDYLLSHLLSYDQVVDMVCHNICTQLIFNRRFFQNRGIDSRALLEKVKQHCIITVDFREFPGSIIKSFVSWLREYLSPPGELMPLYCLVCGGAESHDEHIHGKFYGIIDQGLTFCLERAKSLYDLVTTVISYLLKFPNSRQSFQAVIKQHLHCPFCNGTGGKHNLDLHQQWKQHWKVSWAAPKEPEPAADIHNYTKGTFEYLMDRMPFHVPTFLLKLNNIRSFLDCLVCLWRGIRLQIN